MFKGEKGKSSAEQPDRINRIVSGTKINGNLNIGSSLRLDGEVIGEVKCGGKIVIGKDGVIQGNVTSREIEVEGSINGNVVTEDLLVLRKTAIIQGDIETVRLIIEDGAQIDGKIKTGELQKSTKISSKEGKNSGKKDSKQAFSQEDQPEVIY